VITPDLAIICISRRRADTIGKYTLALAPFATVCIGADEVRAYQGVSSASLLTHPKDVVGIGPLRQWVLDHVPSRAVIMLDDDISKVYSLVGDFAKRISDPLDVLAILQQTAIVAEGVGARIFGFNQAWDVRKYHPLAPFSLNAWVGGVIGFIGRDIHFDQRLKLRADIDACLQSLRAHRIVWQDSRFAFEHKRFAGKGGNSAVRSHDQHERELAILREKWGAHLQVREGKTAVRLTIHVDRRQPGS